MMNLLHKISSCFMLLLGASFVLIASPQLRLIPVQNPVIGDNGLSLLVVLSDENGGDVNNVHTLRFQITSSLPNGCFSAPATVNIEGNWIGGVANINSLLELCPSTSITNGVDGASNTSNGISSNNSNEGNNSNANNIGPLLQAPQLFRISRNTATNATGHGQVALLGSIMTIDELSRPDDDSCVEFTVIASQVEIISKIDLTTNEITNDDLVTSLPDASTTVLFCPKCEANNIAARPICTADGNSYFVELDFESSSNNNYNLYDQYNQNPTYDTDEETYLFGPYSNNAEARLSILSENDVEACSLNLRNDCAMPTYTASCDDNIMNQNESGIDCDGDCPNCLSCGMTISHQVVGINSTQWEARFEVSGASGSYSLTDNLSNTPQYVNGSYIFGPYNISQTMPFYISANGMDNCSRKISLGYDNVSQCNSNAPNDICSNAIPISNGIANGPYNNYCAQNNSSSDPIGNICMMDGINNSVWHSFTPTNSGFISLYAGKPDNSQVTDYENDLQMAVYSNCPATNPIACADDVIDYQPAVFFEAQAGQTYYILIDGYGHKNSAGQYFLYTCEAPVIAANISPISCPDMHDGAISLNVSGNYAPFTYKWQDGSTSPTLSNLNAGTYKVTVTNSQGCFNIQSFTVAEATGIQFDIALAPAPNGGIGAFSYNTATINIQNAVAPYSFNWNNNGYVRYDISYATNQIVLHYANNATWNLTLTDSNGCQQTAHNQQNQGNDYLDIVNYTIQPETSGNNGSISLEVQGGTTPYTYTWSNGSNGASLSNLSKGWYAVSISDSSTPTQLATGWYWVEKQRRGREKQENMALNMPSWSLVPNLLNNSDQIYLNVNYSGEARLQLFDLSGRYMLTLFEGDIDAGNTYNIDLNRELSKGIYIAQLSLNNGNMGYQKISIVR
jgi:hypothetical protein